MKTLTKVIGSENSEIESLIFSYCNIGGSLGEKAASFFRFSKEKKKCKSLLAQITLQTDERKYTYSTIQTSGSEGFFFVGLLDMPLYKHKLYKCFTRTFERDLFFT